MLTYRNTSIVFMLMMLCLMGCDYIYEFSDWYYLIPLILFGLAIFWGSYFIQSSFFLKAHCGGDENQNLVAITFDDGPHENTPGILDILKKHHSKAAFFCIGKNIPGRESTVARISEEGHVIGNHSYSHSNLFDFFPVSMLHRDVAKADDLILQVTGKRNRIFRPPFGVTTPAIARLTAEKGYDVIGWNVRSYDTSIKDRVRLLNRIFSQVKGGSVILLHDTTPGITDILDKLLEYITQRNLKVVSIEVLFNIKANEPL